MTKIAGVDVLVYVEDPSTQLPVLIGGQSGAELSRSTDMIEVSTKTSGKYKENYPSTFSWELSLDAYLVLPNDGEVDSYQLLEDAYNESRPVKIEIQMPNKTKYSGEAFAQEMPLSFSMDDMVSFSTTFLGNGPLVKTTEPVVPTALKVTSVEKSTK